MIPLFPLLAHTTSTPPPEDSQSARKPVYRLVENGDGYSLIVQLPGVDKAGMDVVAKNGVLSIRGRREWHKPAAWKLIHRESSDANFALEFSYDARIEADRIQAVIANGVLTVTLPKSTDGKPRQIPVT
ncbi:MAG: Hsp20/alpha crystallin family protein [Opitutus sp.]|nr:Hsp20/alpha crystallin family protein [Opitutus sp.]MCS6246209.1 Hsp20/alpha crystallin family protein [Opitutus sp.]MCS6275433.1 Hsp20/alpha crystallin family protein [Opitutus sp.]MCS6277216.1 Hsp20/alpha crystallin family protein [Opitutus sp.]MCS6300338.1 Hsp20/alpha crystallin family protein [Opitutus sp.]